jgi:hypothetical protein
MAEFVELAGMAIANAEAEQKLRELADTQASLRRLTMLVARGEPPEVLFAAVTKEVQYRDRRRRRGAHERDRRPAGNLPWHPPGHPVQGGLRPGIARARAALRHPGGTGRAGRRPASRARRGGRLLRVSEMLANAAKHARASMTQVDAEASGGTLRVRVHDDGIGGATPAQGSGLLGLKDRIEALGGTFSVHSPAGRGTTVSRQLPVNADGEQ